MSSRFLTSDRRNDIIVVKTAKNGGTDMKRLLAIALAWALLCAVGCTGGSASGSGETAHETERESATDSTPAGDGYTAFY